MARLVVTKLAEPVLSIPDLVSPIWQCSNQVLNPVSDPIKLVFFPNEEFLRFPLLS